MDPTDILNAARAGLTEVAERTADLVAGLPDASAPILPGHWTVREAAVHTTVETDTAAEVAGGAPCPDVYTDKATANALHDAHIAEIPETDPHKLAGLLSDAAGRLLDATARRSGEARITFLGIDINLASLTCAMFGEYLVHGYDIANATGRPWPIDPVHAQLTLAGLAPFFPLFVHPETSRGHTAAYAIELRGGEGLVLRFTDGALTLEAAGVGPVDCVISADPIAFLLVGYGRMTRWQAIALGLLSAGGDRPELALGFLDLFDIP